MTKISSILAFVAISVTLTQATHRGVFYEICGPYTSGGQQRVGAQEPCNNACFAVNKGGKPGRLTRQANRVEDRGCSAGTGGNSPCTNNNSPYAGHPGNSCDEYPFAITGEGAASGNAAVLRCVPSGENSSGGAQLNNFFNSAGVVVGDTFDVGVSWDPNNPPVFCANAAMNNDGTEFHYVNGGLSNARRGPRDFDSRALADVDGSLMNNNSNPIRFAKTYKGRMLLILSKEAKEGDAVWGDANSSGDDTIANFIDPAEATESS